MDDLNGDRWMLGKDSRYVFSYKAYNLGIYSEISLPELIESDAPHDIFIRNGRVDIPSEWKPLDYAFADMPQGMVMYWNGVGSISVSDGREIVVDTEAFPEVSRLRLFLLGAALGTALHQRGLPVFHASSVSFNGRAVMFVGDKGWGKSTMAAILHSRGHKFLVDDVVALSPQDEGFAVLPSFPQIKLWPDALESLGEDPEGLPLLSTLFDKRHRGLEDGFGSTEQILDRIYLLDVGDKVEISSVRQQDALIQLIRNLYVARFGEHMLKPGDPTHFYQCADIVNKVPVFALRRPSSLDLLGDVADLVENHVSGGLENAVPVGAA